jgi:hypothetical protein
MWVPEASATCSIPGANAPHREDDTTGQVRAVWRKRIDGGESPTPVHAEGGEQEVQRGILAVATALTLKQSNAVQALARAVQDYLPGSGARQWKGHITFATVAGQAGVAEFWAAAGSKVPRLPQLFETTLLHRPQSFERLVVGIVKEGLRYKSGGESPVTPNEIKIINGHILDLGFKFPDLTRGSRRRPECARPSVASW